MLKTKEWLCNAIVALVIVLALGLVLTKPQSEPEPDRLTVAGWTVRTLSGIFHKWVPKRQRISTPVQGAQGPPMKIPPMSFVWMGDHLPSLFRQHHVA